MTQEEVIKILEILHQRMDYPTKEALAIAIDYLSQPPLPSNLDEAAFEYENELWESGYKNCGYSPQEVNDAFKAGAEWMAGQGYTTEETVYFERLCDETRIMVDFGPTGERGGFHPGDKVIVQIRKKQ